MRILQVGTGRWGTNHMRVLHNLGVDLYIAKLSESERQRCLSEGVPQDYISADLNDFIGKVDAVDIVTPAQTHLPIALTTIAHNKDIFTDTGSFSGFKRPRNDGGVTISDAIHFVDLYNYLMDGPPQQVMAQCPGRSRCSQSRRCSLKIVSGTENHHSIRTSKIGKKLCIKTKNYFSRPPFNSAGCGFRFTETLSTVFNQPTALRHLNKRIQQFY